MTIILYHGFQKGNEKRKFEINGTLFAGREKKGTVRQQKAGFFTPG